MAKITERGWAGHFICADRCLFRRNTLIEGEKDSVVVSTVGAMQNPDRDGLEEIGASGRYYETMIFGAKLIGVYVDADVSDQRSNFASDWSICADKFEDLQDDVDNKANEMHEAIVAEFANKIT